MNIRFTLVPLAEIEGDIHRYLTSLPSTIESFTEDHIVQANLYRIVVEERYAGFTAVHGGSLITQFFLFPAFRREAQEIYRRVKKLENVQAALVTTCDEFFLSHALDEYRLLAKQGYIFALGSAPDTPARSETVTLQTARLSDVDLIRAGSGEFFHDLEAYIEREEIFLALREETCVGYGITARSRLCGPVASIGMFVREEYRQQGVGSAILRLLQGVCREDGRRPIAGCWYYNHLSKRTLESAGMVTASRLFRIDY